MNTIDGFRGEYRFLSNFWPCYLLYDGLLYPTVEHAYQAAKFNSPVIKQMIRNCDTPAEAKDYPALHNLEVDQDWTIERKLVVMKALITIKFSGKEPLLTRALLATGDAVLIEGNTWNDTFWGVCNNTGENNSGKILMDVRKDLFLQKEQILTQLQLQKNNTAVAATLSISENMLYEKMIAFSIQNKEYWIM